MSVRGEVNVVAREMFRVPSATIAIVQSRFPPWIADALNSPFLRMRFPDLEQLGLRRSRRGPLTTMVERGRTPLIDIGTIKAIREGRIRIFPGIKSSEGQVVHFENGKHFQCDAIILATGYRAALEKLLPDVDQRFPDAGKPSRGNLQPGGDGLYFCGFNPATSGLLRQIGIEANAISRMIAG